jgi:hypothetical protein
MSNLTITVDDHVLVRARRRALEQGTSVNAVLRSYLETYAGADEQARAVDALLRASERSGAGRDGNTWTRDELHER